MQALARAAGVLFVALLLGACRQPPAAGAAPARLGEPPHAPFLMFISAAADDSFRRVAMTDLAKPGGPAYITGLFCERVYFSGSRGICLTSASEGRDTKWYAEVFDERFHR